MKIENRQKFLLMLTIGMMALYAGVNFVYEPLAGWWSDRAAEIKDLRGRLSDGRKLLTRADYIQDQWSDIQSNSLPANTSAAEQQLLRSVDDWSRSTGAEVSSIMPQWKNDDTNYMTLTCRVETAGDLGTLTKFLYDLESGPQAIRLDTVELGVHDTAGQQFNMSVDIDGLALGAQEVVK